MRAGVRGGACSRMDSCVRAQRVKKGAFCITWAGRLSTPRNFVDQIFGRQDAIRGD